MTGSTIDDHMTAITTTKNCSSSAVQKPLRHAQVELQYPPAKERPTRAAGAADAPQPLSFRPGEAPKAAALPQWAPDQARCPLGFRA